LAQRRPALAALRPTGLPETPVTFDQAGKLETGFNRHAPPMPRGIAYGKGRA